MDLTVMMRNDELLFRQCGSMQGTDTVGSHFSRVYILAGDIRVPTSSVQTSRIDATMFRTTRKSSFHQRTNTERLLPAIMLHGYPIDTATHTSPLAYNASKP